MKDYIIRVFGLKGSWSWAKKQMMKGFAVRCRHWSGVLRLKIDSPENTLLQSSFTGGKDLMNRIEEWETSNHFLSYENFTDYCISDNSVLN